MTAPRALGAALCLALASPAVAIPPPLPAEEMRARTVVDGMVRAYDARKVAEFSEFFDPSIEVYLLGDRPRLAVRGKAQLAAYYRGALARPLGEEWTRITSLQVTGDFVSTIEQSESAAGPQRRSVVLYQLSGYKIRRMWLTPQVPSRAD